MQMMAMMFAGQEQQRLTNAWVVQSMEAISASAGCAIEAAPASQEIVTLPPALVRMTQSAARAAPTDDSMATELAAAEPAAGPVVPTLVTNAGGGASPPHPTKRGRGRGAGAAAATAAAIKTTASTPTRATTKQPPGHVGAPPTPEEMDGLGDDEDAGQDGQLNPHVTAEVLQCLYENLCDNEKPTKAQLTVGGAREHTSPEIEEDAQRVEEQPLALTPPPQDF